MNDTGEVDLEEFRRAAHRLADWVADYLAHTQATPVLARVKPGEIKSALPSQAPAQGEPLARLLDDAERVILPGITHWNHPGFLAYFANTGSAPGILGEMLAAALNVNGMLWRTSPAATELEQVVLGWLRDLLGSAHFFGVITDTASVSSLLALAAARDRALPDARAQGLGDGPRLRLYASEQAHSSIDKAAILLGVGLDNLVKVATDGEFRMDPLALERAIEKDHRDGHSPFAVVATLGTTSTTSVDPLPAIGEVARGHGLWLHVDAAYAGAAAAAPELRWVLEGAELADSVVMNPHKWLFTPMDLSVLWVKDREELRRAFSLVAEYLKTPENDVVNYMDYGVQLGRRFRALKLWFVLRAYGKDGLASRIREHVRLGAELAARVDAHPDLERLAPAPLSVVCLRYRPRDLAARAAEPDVAAYLERLNQAVLERVNAGGEVFLSHTRLGGTYALRVAIGNIGTTVAHVRRAEELVVEHGGACDRELRR